jgi:hypothetical protein
MAVLINKVPDIYTVSLGSACVYVSQYSQFYGRLTNNPGVMVCLGAGHTSDAGCIPFGCQPNNWGSARVFTNCSGCGTLTALAAAQITLFSLTEQQDQNILKWQLVADAGDYLFYIERSADGKNFYILDSIYAGRQRSFSYIDATVPEGASYYRVRGIDINSRQAVASKVVSSVSKQFAGIRAYPSPFTEYFFIVPLRGQSVLKIVVHDLAGNKIPVSYRQEGNEWKVTPQTVLSRQMLVVRVTTNTGTYLKKIIAG